MTEHFSSVLFSSLFYMPIFSAQTQKNVTINKWNEMEFETPNNYTFKTIHTIIRCKKRTSEDLSVQYCNNCGNYNISFDQITQEKVCTNCGMVIDTSNFSTLPPRIIKPNQIHHEPIAKTFKRKTISASDLKLCENKSNFIRQFGRDGYYDSNERKQNTVDYIFTNVKKILSLPQYIIDYAWNHYKYLEKYNIFIGKNISALCYAFIYISLLQNDRPIQFQKYYSSILTSVDPISKKEFRKAKNYIINSSNKYAFPLQKDKLMLSADQIIDTIIIGLREQLPKLPLNESQLLKLQIDSKKLCKKALKYFSYDGSVNSSIPSILYYLSKMYKIPLTYDDLIKVAYVSAQSIRKKYQILVQHYGNPKERKKERKNAIKN